MKKIIAVALAAMLSAAMLFTGCTGGSSQDAVQSLKTAAESMKTIQTVNQVSTLDIQILQEDAPNLDFFKKKITAGYTDSGANGAVELEGEMLRTPQNISVVFKDGTMYQNVDGMRYVPMPEEAVSGITAASADMLQMYRYKLPAKLAEMGEKLDQLSQKKEGNTTVITGKVTGENAREMGKYFFLDFLLGDEEILEQNRQDMLESLKAERDAMEEAEKEKYPDEELEKMVQEQMDYLHNNTVNLFDTITIDHISYTGTLENGYLTNQTAEVKASYQNMKFSMMYTDTLTNINGTAEMELPELTEENTLTLEEYQQEMMMMQMFMQQMQQQAAGQ